MVVLLNGALTMRRALIAGFLMGLCFGVSMKTSLLGMSTVIGGSMTLIFVGRERLGIGWRQILGALTAFFATALIVPATIMAAFALYGIWPQFRYWIFDHNVVPGLTNHPGWWVIIFAVGFPLVALEARRAVAATPETIVAARQRFDFVFDRRGETVFRQRCFYPIIETFTKERIRRGLMADNTIQRCIDTRTCVAILPDDMPLATFRFLEQNYLPIGNRLRVAGIRLHSSTDEKHFDFEIVIPASYKIIARDVGTVMGVLDGERYEGKERFLSPGTHTFVQTSTGHDLVVFWAQAVDRHFRPTQW